MTLFLVVYIAPLVDSTVLPSEPSMALHLVDPPLSIKGSAICPLVDSMAFYLIVYKRTVICATIGPLKVTFAMFLAS